MSFIDLIIKWSWCTGEHNIMPIIHMIRTVLDVIRIVVPIGLIVMTSFDVAKKVINPVDNDGQKKIMIRAIAALIVFLLPTLIKLTLSVVEAGTDVELLECWEEA